MLTEGSKCCAICAALRHLAFAVPFCLKKGIIAPALLLSRTTNCNVGRFAQGALETQIVIYDLVHSDGPPKDLLLYVTGRNFLLSLRCHGLSQGVMFEYRL